MARLGKAIAAAKAKARKPFSKSSSRTAATTTAFDEPGPSSSCMTGSTTTKPRMGAALWRKAAAITPASRSKSRSKAAPRSLEDRPQPADDADAVELSSIATSSQPPPRSGAALWKSTATSLGASQPQPRSGAALWKSASAAKTSQRGGAGSGASSGAKIRSAADSLRSYARDTPSDAAARRRRLERTEAARSPALFCLKVPHKHAYHPVCRRQLERTEAKIPSLFFFKVTHSHTD